MSINELVYTRYLMAFAQVCAGDGDLVGAATEEQAVAVALGARDGVLVRAASDVYQHVLGPQSKADVEKHVAEALRPVAE